MFDGVVSEFALFCAFSGDIEWLQTGLHRKALCRPKLTRADLDNDKVSSGGILEEYVFVFANEEYLRAISVRSPPI
ncbi:MAG TPA: hypothetical protein VEZ90_11900 [Blastocatellia bacterium]|nr:hypothetical protein [Blastocatellia bacterium]